MIQIIIHGQYRNNKTTCVGTFSNGSYIEKFRRDLFMKRVRVFFESLHKFKSVTLEIKKDGALKHERTFENNTPAFIEVIPLRQLGLILRDMQRLELNHIARIIEDVKTDGRNFIEQSFDSSFVSKVSQDLYHNRIDHRVLNLNDSMTVQGLTRIIINCSQELVIIRPKGGK